MAGADAARGIVDVRSEDAVHRKKWPWVWLAVALACVVLLSKRRHSLFERPRGRSASPSSRVHREGHRPRGRDTRAPDPKTTDPDDPEAEVPAGAPPAHREPKWTDPHEDGSCPETHPVKAKTSSGIYHVPGGSLYSRTKPDRCYCDEEAARADGFRRSKV
ncbi:MAG: hypothetical protein KatS3mg008_0990 [Acidimicrobiales bacterium]|nr:MAG: hypothetical protein KatS3mg008_0990 [Acidimicrobiales bacterium]